MIGGQAKFQIGKNGITSGVLDSLTLYFKKHKIVRISMLKNAGHDRDSVKDIAENLKKQLEGTYNTKIIGFTIILRKLRH